MLSLSLTSLLTQSSSMHQNNDIDSKDLGLFENFSQCSYDTIPHGLLMRSYEQTIPTEINENSKSLQNLQNVKNKKIEGEGTRREFSDRCMVDMLSENSVKKRVMDVLTQPVRPVVTVTPSEMRDTTLLVSSDFCLFFV